jgi:hypothetical protein
MPSAARAHTPWCNVPPPGVHVRTHRGATYHGRCTRAHTPWCNVPRPVYTCTHSVVQRATAGVHVHTHRGARSHGGCTRARTSGLAASHDERAPLHPAYTVTGESEPVTVAASVVYTFSVNAGAANHAVILSRRSCVGEAEAAEDGRSPPSCLPRSSGKSRCKHAGGPSTVLRRSALRAPTPERRRGGSQDDYTAMGALMLGCGS